MRARTCVFVCLVFGVPVCVCLCVCVVRVRLVHSVGVGVECTVALCGGAWRSCDKFGHACSCSDHADKR